METTETPSFSNTWWCVVHGHCGDINGPVHYAVCQRRHHARHDNWLERMMTQLEVPILYKTWMPDDDEL